MHAAKSARPAPVPPSKRTTQASNPGSPVKRQPGEGLVQAASVQGPPVSATMAELTARM
jgi:hypothetical protein